MDRTTQGKMDPCPLCEGSGEITAQRSGDWRQDPEHVHPATLVPCRYCGGTGLVPKRGTYEEAY